MGKADRVIFFYMKLRIWRGRYCSWKLQLHESVMRSVKLPVKAKYQQRGDFRCSFALLTLLTVSKTQWSVGMGTYEVWTYYFLWSNFITYICHPPFRLECSGIELEVISREFGVHKSSVWFFFYDCKLLLK